MISKVLLTIAISIALFSCNGQNTRKESENTGDTTPKTDIKVNKEYDDQGNLIRYDSTYSYYYSNIKDDSKLKDSIFSSFKQHFNDQFFFSDRPYFNNLFFQDSLLFYDFYKDDFFQNRFKSNMGKMDRMFWEMDSIKNYYFLHQFDTSKRKLKL